MTLLELVARWRHEAELLRAHGAVEAAATKVHDAADLEETLRQRQIEELTPTQAAAEEGCDPSTIRRRFPGRKKIRREELAMPAGADGPNLAAIILRESRR